MTILCSVINDQYTNVFQQLEIFIHTRINDKPKEAICEYRDLLRIDVTAKHTAIDKID